MAVDIKVSKENLVWSAPVNDATSKWGVYCIPRMWRMPDGRLVVRFNGEEDSCLLDGMQKAPNMYFVSEDNGESWNNVENGDSLFDYNAILGIGSPYLKLKNGTYIVLREKDNREPIKNTKHCTEIKHPDGEAIAYGYRYGDIPDCAKGVELVRYNLKGEEIERKDAFIDFPERMILVNAFAPNEEGEYVPVEQYLRPYFLKNPYLSCLTELSDGTLVATTTGQHHDVLNRYCGAVYLVESTDGGITWKKRGNIATATDKTPYGYSGDGYENTLTLCENGDLICVMRMDMTINAIEKRPLCDTYVAISHDNGYTWCEPFSAADCSITPQVRALKDGIAVLIYGRPGVHLKVSEDNGKTWSDSVSIIGKTLEEERALGRDDIDSKYEDTVSYSNSFAEIISEDTILVHYTNLKYDEGDGVMHKAGFVKKIRVKKIMN